MEEENHTRRWVLDVSRLFARLHHAAPRGIDRVQLRYVAAFLEDADARFVVHARGRWTEVPRALVRECAAMVERRWALGDNTAADTLARCALAVTSRFRGVREPVLAAVGQRLDERAAPRGTRLVYVNVSHRDLQHIGSLRSCLGAPLDIVVLLHDLMPITRPGEFGPSMRETFAAGMEAVRRHADLVLTNSLATTDELDSHWGPDARWGGAPRPPVVTVGLGHDAAALAPSLGLEPPRFVFVGPTEPRKNLSLMLEVWRRLAEESGPLPTLHIVGPAGAQVAAELPTVRVHAAPSDAEVRRLLVGSRALLVPSRAEGLGLPVIEALSLGTPAICSDLPSLREASQGLADHLPVDDLGAWTSQVRAYARDSGGPREAQLERIAGFRPPAWSAHFVAVRAALDAVASQGGARSLGVA